MISLPLSYMHFVDALSYVACEELVELVMLLLAPRILRDDFIRKSIQRILILLTVNTYHCCKYAPILIINEKSKRDFA